MGKFDAYVRMRSAAQRGVDRLLRVRTADGGTASVLGLSEGDIGNFRASGWVGTWRTIRALRPSEEDVFLDVGSGAGRAVYIASRFPFRRVIGVERSPELHRLAQENLGNARWLGRARTELVCADVATYSIPDDVTVVYLYNPIFHDVLESFAGRLTDSVDRVPRRLRIAYYNPQHEERFLAGGRGRFREIGRLRAALRIDREKARSFETVLYEVVSEDGLARRDGAGAG